MEEREYYVYRHIRLDKNEVFYVGIGSKRLNYTNRYQEYPRAYSKQYRNKHWRNIVKQTGYKIEILFETSDYQELINKEIEFIELYGRRHLNTGTLVNITSGGEGTFGMKMSEETKRKIGEKQRGRTKTEAERKAISERMLGKTLTYEQRLKVSLSNKGRRRTPEQNEENRKRAVERYKDPNFKSKIRNKSKYLYLDTETGIYYDYFKDACEANNLNHSVYKNRLNNDRPNKRFIRVIDEERIDQVNKKKFNRN